MTEHTSEQVLNLTGHFLIAMPDMGDPVFAGTVTYILIHDEDGALGVIINRPLGVDLHEVLEATNISEYVEKVGDLAVYHGGPVTPEQGFILHRRREQSWASAIQNDDMSLTTSRDILVDIATESGPEEFIFCLGYSGWTKGQIEEELKLNAWLTVEANTDIIFASNEDKYRQALLQLGIDQAVLSGQGGHA
jgi:putative transcriptional regulator